MSRSTRRAAVFACALLFAATAAGAQTSRNATFLANVNTSSTYSNCTSYIAGDGREYAALGTGTGTQIFRITDPSAPVLVGTIVGPSSAWREMKQYRDHLYIVSEGTGTGKGLDRKSVV